MRKVIAGTKVRKDLLCHHALPPSRKALAAVDTKQSLAIITPAKGQNFAISRKAG